MTLTKIDQKGLEKTCVMNIGQDLRSQRQQSVSAVKTAQDGTTFDVLMSL